MDLLQDGADLRFIAADDATRLAHHVELFDPAAGVAIVWVRLPEGDASIPGASHFWMYYGNGQAASVEEPAAVFDPLQTLSFSFGEGSGLPQDATGFQHHAEGMTGTQRAPGVIGQGLLMQVDSALRLPATPALTPGTQSGLTFATWIRLVDVPEQAVVFRRADGRSLLELGIAAGAPYVRLAGPGEEPVTLESGTALASDRWYHLAITLGAGRLGLYVDGQRVQEREAPLPDLGMVGSTIGSAGGLEGFHGTIDEVRIWRAPQGQALIRQRELAGIGDLRQRDFMADDLAAQERLFLAETGPRR
ncbi:MAG: DUF2341 domain-containing protein [Chromatiales bacterium]|nr:DUF2341 domain-containing protein [Chromatiales bacterium]